MTEKMTTGSIPVTRKKARPQTSRSSSSGEFSHLLYLDKPFHLREGVLVKRSPFLLFALIISLSWLLAIRATAQTFTNLHNFTGTDGSTPYARLVLSGSTLYGTTTAGANSGGSSGDGTIFAINT